MSFSELSVTLVADSFSEESSGGRVSRYLATLLTRQGATVTVAAPDVQSADGEFESTHLFQLNGGRMEGLKHLLPPTYIREFRDHLRISRADVVHFCPLGYSKSSYLFAAAADYGARTIGQIWGYDYFCGRLYNYLDGSVCSRCVDGSFSESIRHACGPSHSRLLQAISRRRLFGYARSCDAYLSPASVVDDALVASGVPVERLVRMPLPFDPKRVLGLRAEDGDTFVFYGQSRDIKGVGLLPAICEACPAVKFRICMSTAPSDATSAAAIMSLQRLPNVALDRTAWGGGLAQIAASARGILLPSLWPSTTETVLLEALGLGKPVVAFAVGVHRDVLLHRDNAMLANDGDIVSYIEAILALDADSELRQRVGRSARVLFQTMTDESAILSPLARAYFEA